MKSLVLTLVGLFAVSPCLVHAKIERVVEKSFPVSSAGQLLVRTQGGAISVRTDPQASTVIVKARQVLETSSESEADQLLSKLTLEIGQSGNEIKAQARYPEPPTGFSLKKWPPVVVHFDVSVPAGFNADLATSGGDITLTDLRGNAKVATSGGDLRLGRIRGKVDGSTSGGDIALESHTEAAKLSTSGGDIRVIESLAPATLTTSGGEIVVEMANSAVKATTSGGDIRVNLADAVVESVVLVSSGGDVAVTLGKTSAFHLDASTSGGDVKARGLVLEIEKGAPGKSKLVGRVNGGGPEMKLRTSGGDVRVSVR